MAKNFLYYKSNNLPVYSKATNNPQFAEPDDCDCCGGAGVDCTCEGNTPITCTITTTGTCDETSANCGYDCAGDVIFLTWIAGAQHWFGASSVPPATTGWTCMVWCDDSLGPAIWYMTVTGGCGDDSGAELSIWNNKIFVPTGCVQNFALGYPTVAGLNLGNPTVAGACWIDCIPTVSLS